MDQSGCATNGCGLPGPLDENTAEAVDGSDDGVWAYRVVTKATP
jgi:hypothetical protein